MSSSPDGDRYPIEGDGHRAPCHAESEGNQTDSDRDERGSGGDQTGSGGARNPTQAPRSASNPEPEDDRQAADYTASLARVAAQRERDERNRAPGTWMPGPEDFDGDPKPADDTDFGTDGPPRDYTSRQLGIRLRPKHWERLLEAARLYGVRPTTMARMMIVRGTNAIYDAELRARARELRESGSE